MKNCNKIKQTCASPTFASCVTYEDVVNENSPLNDDCSISVEEVLKDIYAQLEEINLSELGETCLEYVENEEGRIIVKNVLLKFEEELCLIKEKIEILESIDICDKNITSCNLDFGDLTNACNTQPTTMKDVLQLILDTIQP